MYKLLEIKTNFWTDMYCQVCELSVIPHSKLQKRAMRQFNFLKLFLENINTYNIWPRLCTEAHKLRHEM